MSDEMIMNEELEENAETERESVDLTPDNAKFFRSGGGLVSLKVKYDDETVDYERVAVIRAFPVSNPDEFISVRVPSSRRGNGREIGMIRNISDFDAETCELINGELARRYFTPEILKINSVKDKFGYIYFDSVTSAGKVTFVVNNPYSNFRKLENGSVLITDVDGNCFSIKEPAALDKASYKKIEAYM